MTRITRISAGPSDGIRVPFPVDCAREKTNRASRANRIGRECSSPACGRDDGGRPRHRRRLRRPACRSRHGTRRTPGRWARRRRSDGGQTRQRRRAPIPSTTTTTQMPMVMEPTQGSCDAPRPRGARTSRRRRASRAGRGGRRASRAGQPGRSLSSAGHRQVCVRRPGRHQQVDDPLAGRTGRPCPGSPGTGTGRRPRHAVVAHPHRELVDLERHVAARRALRPHRRHRRMPPHRACMPHGRPIGTVLGVT